MKGYFTYFKKQIISGLQYKGAALSGLATQYFWGIITAVVYTALYKVTSVKEINLQELMSYLWLNQSFFALIYLDDRDTDIFNMIKNGEIAYELMRPYNLYKWWFIKIIAKRYSSVALRCLPIIVVSFLLPKPYNLSMPNSLLSLLLFLISILLGSFVIVEINLIIITIGFYTNEDKGISSIIYRIGELFSGIDIPLPLLPNIIITVGNFFPFRYIGDLAFRIYSGNVGIDLAIKYIFIQIIWIILLYIIGNLLMNNVLKKATVQGG